MPQPRTTEGIIEKVYFSLPEAALIIHEDIRRVRSWFRELGLSVRRTNRNQVRLTARDVNDLLRFKVLVTVDGYRIGPAAAKIREARAKAFLGEKNLP